MSTQVVPFFCSDGHRLVHFRVNGAFVSLLGEGTDGTWLAASRCFASVNIELVEGLVTQWKVVTISAHYPLPSRSAALSGADLCFNGIAQLVMGTQLCQYMACQWEQLCLIVLCLTHSGVP